MKKQKLNRKHKYRIIKQVPIEFQQNTVSYLVTSARGRRHKACDEFVNLLQEELLIDKEEENKITKLSIKDQIKLEMNQLNESKMFLEKDFDCDSMMLVKQSKNIDKDPIDILNNIFNHFRQAENTLTKLQFTQRVTPFQYTAHEHDLETFEKRCGINITKTFSSIDLQGKSYAIQLRRRRTNASREEITEAIVNSVSKANNDNKVDYKNPDMTIICEIIQNYLGISIVSSKIFKDNHKYNFQQLYLSEI